jgi:serpin B
MAIVLPDEGVSAEDLLADSQCMDFVINHGEWENEKIVLVNLSLPKFDVSSQIDLEEGLKSLGVTDVFDPTVSDFSSIIPEADMAKVEQATHGARVQIDEEGCVATAYTIITDTNGALPPNEEIDFVVDRPFLFVIYSPSNLPLFVGIVNQPQ